jgi:hypothetical protein
MNETAKNKIQFIETELHKMARKNCPKFLEGTCEDCDIECPYDTLLSALHHIKNGEIVCFTTVKEIIEKQERK